MALLDDTQNLRLQEAGYRQPAPDRQALKADTQAMQMAQREVAKTQKLQAAEAKPFAEPADLSFSRKRKNKIGEVENFRKQELAEFDKNEGRWIAEKPDKETGLGGELLGLESLQADAEDRVGLIKGALSSQVAGEPTEKALKARQVLDDTLKQVQSRDPSVQSVADLGNYREALKQKRARIATEHDRIKALKTEAELDYGQRMASQYGLLPDDLSPETVAKVAPNPVAQTEKMVAEGKAKPEDVGTIRGLVNNAQNAFDSARQALTAANGLDANDAAELARLEYAKAARQSAPGYAAYQQAEGWDAVKAFASNPFEVTSNIVAEGLVGSLPILAAGFGAGATGAGIGAAAGSIVPGAGNLIGAGGGFTTGMVLGTGAGSFAVEYGGKILEELQKAGMDLKDERSITEFFSRPELLDAAKGKAIKRGVPVAIFDAASAGLAGRLGTIGKAALNTPLRVAAAETLTQAAAGGLGEVAGSLAAGDDVSGKAVFGEVVGELGPGAAEVVAGRLASGATTPVNQAPPASAQGDATVPLPAAPVTPAAIVPDEDFTPAVDDELANELANQSPVGMVETPAAQPASAPATPAPTSSAPVDTAPAPPAQDVNNPQVETPLPSVAEVLVQPAPEDFQYTVQRAQGEQGEIPGYVQVDDVTGGTNRESGNLDTFRARGLDLPDVPDWLPQGRYTLGQIRDAIDKGPPQTEPAPASAPENPVPASKMGVSATTGAGAPISSPEAQQAEQLSPKEPVAGSIPAGAASFSLPRDLAGAKPRYSYGPKQFTLNFASDLDKALYVLAQSTPSKRDADFARAVTEQTGLTEVQARNLGKTVRERIKASAKDAPAGELTVPAVAPVQKIAERKAREKTPSAVTAPAPVEAATGNDTPQAVQPAPLATEPLTQPTAAKSDKPQEKQATPAPAPSAGQVSPAPEPVKETPVSDTRPANVAKKEPKSNTLAPIVPRGTNTPAEFVRSVAKATGLKASDPAAKVLMDFAPRLARLSPTEFAQMEVNALTDAQWKATPATSRNTPDSAAAYDPTSNTLYLNTDKLKSAEDIVSAIVHESGHFAERFGLGTDFTQSQWESLTDGQREAAAREYDENNVDLGEDLKNDPRARAEWVAMQFARVVRGDTQGMNAQLKGRLTKFLAAIREFVSKWIGSGKLSTAELDQRIIAAMFPEGEELTNVTEKAPVTKVNPPAAAPKVAPAKSPEKIADEERVAKNIALAEAAAVAREENATKEKAEKAKRLAADAAAVVPKTEGALSFKDTQAELLKQIDAAIQAAPDPKDFMEKANAVVTGRANAFKREAGESFDQFEKRLTDYQKDAPLQIANELAFDGLAPSKRKVTLKSGTSKVQLTNTKEVLEKFRAQVAKRIGGTSPVTEFGIKESRGTTNNAHITQAEVVKGYKKATSEGDKRQWIDLMTETTLKAQGLDKDYTRVAQGVVMPKEAAARLADLKAGKQGEFDVLGTPATVKTDTPEFKKWFGDSKVVDADGKPLVVYHGTQAPDFSKFEVPSYFAENPSEAGAYTNASTFRTTQKLSGKYKGVEAKGSLDGKRVNYIGIMGDIPKESREVWATDNGVVKRREGGGFDIYVDVVPNDSTYDLADTKIDLKTGKSDALGEAQSTINDFINQRVAGTGGTGNGGRVYPAYLSIKNPKVLPPLEANVFGKRLGAGAKELALIEKLKAEGYDGIETTSDEAAMNPDLAEMAGGKVKQFIPFYPEQIKSATGNRGTFDPANPDILGTPADKVLLPPKNAPVPDEAGKRYRSHTDTLQERGYEAVRTVYETKSNASTKEAANAFLTAAGEAVAAGEIFNATSQLSGPVRVAVGLEIERRIYARSLDANLTPEQRAEAKNQFNRLSNRLAEIGTESGQTSQAFDLVDRVFSEEGAIHSATQQVKKRQDQMLGEEGRKTENEIVDALNAENKKVVDDVLADVKADVRNVKITKKMVEKVAVESPVGKQELDKAIKDAFKEVGTTIRDIIREHTTKVDAIGTSLVDKLTQQAGLTPTESKNLADAVEKRLAEKTTDAKKKVLQRLAKSKGGVSRRMFSIIDKIVEMSNAGALDQPALRARIAEELKLPRVTDTLAKRLKELTDKRLATPEGFQRDRVDTDILTELRKTEGVGKIDIATAIYYSHILSGYTTQLVNIISTAMNTAADVTLAAANAEADALLRRNGAKLGTPTAQAISGLLAGAKAGFSQALATLDTGYANKAFGEKLPDVSPVMEIVSREPAASVGGKALKGYATILRYITRSMKAADAVFYRSANEAFQRVAAAKIAGAMDGGTLTRAEANERIRDLLKMSPAEFESARKQAREERLTGYDRELRVGEIIQQRRSPELALGADRFALESTFNNHPRGALGIIADGVGNVAKKIPALKLFVPFTNIVANVTNASLNYSPLGFARAAKGYLGESKLTDAERAKKNLPTMAQERATLNAKAFAGTTAMVGLLGYALSGDDDEPPFITANGPKDNDRRNQLRQSGWKPHSIKIGDVYVSYLSSPMAVPLAFVGNWADGVKYNDLGKGDTLSNATQAFVGIGSTITEMSFLSGVADLFDTLRGKPGASPEKWAGNVVSSALVPNLVRQVDRTFDPTNYTGDGLTGQLASAIPGLRQQQPERLTPTAQTIESQPVGRFGGVATGDELWDTLNNKGAVISSMHSAKVNNRKATPEEVRLIIRDSGPAIERRLRASLPAIKRMSNEAAESFVQSVAREERARSRDRLPALLRGGPSFNPFSSN